MGERSTNVHPRFRINCSSGFHAGRLLVSAIQCALMSQLRTKTVLEGEKDMKRVFFAAATVATVVAAVAWATNLAEPSQKGIVGLTADEVRWFTPPYYNDGRQRAQLFGDSSQGGTWIDRVKIPGGARVL